MDRLPDCRVHRRVFADLDRPRATDPHGLTIGVALPSPRWFALAGTLSCCIPTRDHLKKSSPACRHRAIEEFLLLVAQRAGRISWSAPVTHALGRRTDALLRPVIVDCRKLTKSRVFAGRCLAFE